MKKLLLLWALGFVRFVPSQEEHAKLAPAVANWLNEILKKY
ncbi:MAG: hypothetical protein SOZ73_00400 [Campylobacter sp.]|nr:hypothetical protein [Campylobacter sp.]MDY3775672.1 hypothetical protein [Campylobacter sp.]